MTALLDPPAPLHQLDPDERPVCIACDQRRPAPTQLICTVCRRRLVDVLDEIRTGYARLDPRPIAGGNRAGRGAPGFGSRSPARDDVLVLTDTRGASHDPDTAQNAPTSLLRAVSWWTDRGREAGFIRARVPMLVGHVDGPAAQGLPPRSVAGECLALREVVDAIARQWWVSDMLAALGAAAHHLRRALHEHEQTIPLGRCPRPEPAAAAEFARHVDEVGPIAAAVGSPLPRCAGEVRAKAWGHTASCRRCRYRWEGSATLRQLGAQLGDAWLDLPGLSRYLRVESLATLRTWALRDSWERERRGGRTLYRLADARASWWRAWDRRNPLHDRPLVPPGAYRASAGWVLLPDASDSQQSAATLLLNL